MTANFPSYKAGINFLGDWWEFLILTNYLRDLFYPPISTSYMRLPLPTICTFLIMCNMLSLKTQAQQAVQDTSNVAHAGAVALRQYHAYLDPEPNLYRGGQYAEYSFLLKEGHPYFGEDRMRKGTVTYNGILYENVLLLYDEVLDLLVMPDPIKVFKIALISNQVDRFTIEDHSFVRLMDSLNPSQPGNGYYEQLYKGRITFLKKEKKTIQDDLSAPTEGVRRLIYTSISYYLKMGEVYHVVKSKKALLRLLKDRSRDAKKFIRQNHLSFSDDKENSLVKVVAWYDVSNR